MKKTILKLSVLLSIVFLNAYVIIGCSTKESVNEENEEEEVVIEDTDFIPTDWTTETHSKDAEPNFDEVFDNTTVKRFDFVISEEKLEIRLQVQVLKASRWILDR